MLKQSPAFTQLQVLAAVRLAQPVQQTELAELTGGNTANHAPVAAWFTQVGQDVCSTGMVQSAGDSRKLPSRMSSPWIQGGNWWFGGLGQETGWQ